VDEPLAAGQTQVASQPKGRTTAAYYLAFVILGMILAVLGPTLPYLARQTSSQLSQASFLFTARALGGFMGALLSGRLYDRGAGHLLLIVTLLTFFVSFVLLPFIPLLWLLSLLLFITGVAEGGLDVGINTLLVWIHGRGVGPFMNGLHFFFGLGAFLSPIVIAQVLAYNGEVRWGFWILAFLVLPALFWIWRLPSPPAPEKKKESSAPQSANAVIVLLMAVLLALYVGAEIGFGGWIFSYAVALDLASETTAAYLTSLFWGAFTGGRLLAIPIAVWLSPRTILFGDLLIAGSGVALILFGHNSQPAAWIGTALAGAGMASVFPTVLTLAERRVPITGKVTSAFFVGGSIGAMTLPWLMGQLFSAISPTATMLAILVDLFIALLTLGLLLRLAPGGESG
jgi:FHS family Na+ dependent glucose MFS transporter 1